MAAQLVISDVPMHIGAEVYYHGDLTAERIGAWIMGTPNPVAQLTFVAGGTPVGWQLQLTTAEAIQLRDWINDSFLAWEHD